MKEIRAIVSEDKKEVEMLITGSIGVNVDGNLYAEKMLNLFNAGVRKFTHIINSVGGNIHQGQSIIYMNDLLHGKGAEIITVNAGIAYSMAGFIFLQNKGVKKAVSYARTMIHTPRFGGDAKSLSPEAKKYLETSIDAFSEMIAPTLGVEVAAAKAFLIKEDYLKAQDLKDKGLIDEVIGENDIKAETEEELYSLVAEKLINNKFKINKKMNELNAILNLNAEASETARIQAVKELQAIAEKVVEVEDKNKNLEIKVAELNAEVEAADKDAKRVKAEALISKHEAKISADVKFLWIEDAIVNFDATEKKLNGMVASVQNINDTLNSETEKELAEKFGKLLAESPEQLDLMSKEEVEKMEKAFDKFNK